MQDMDKAIDELTLMLLYLTSWQECPTEEIRHKPIRTAEKLRLTWKGHDRSALSRLDAAGLVLNDCGKAPIRISQDGEARAQDLLRQYGISCADASTTQTEERVRVRMPQAVTCAQLRLVRGYSSVPVPIVMYTGALMVVVAGMDWATTIQYFPPLL